MYGWVRYSILGRIGDGVMGCQVYIFKQHKIHENKAQKKKKNTEENMTTKLIQFEFGLLYTKCVSDT